jgi:hypothetical protein
VSCVSEDQGPTPTCESLAFRGATADAGNGCVVSATCHGKARRLECHQAILGVDGGLDGGTGTAAGCDCIENDRKTKTVAFDRALCESPDTTGLDSIYETARSKCGWSD